MHHKKNTNGGEVCPKTLTGELNLNIKQLREKYVNHTFHCQRCILGIVQENTFVDCHFPQLITMTLTDPQVWSFVRCTFPKLRSITFTHPSHEESIFVSCKFSGHMNEELDSNVYSNCYYHDDYSDQYGFLYDLNDSYEWHALDNIEIIDKNELDKLDGCPLLEDEPAGLNMVIHTSYIDDLA